MGRKCLIYKGGKVDQPLTDMFEYVDLTPAASRNVEKFETKLLQTGIAAPHLGSMYIVKNEFQEDNLARVNDLNSTYGDIIKVTPRRLKEGVLYELEVSPEALRIAPLSPHFLDEVYDRTLSDEQLPGSVAEGAAISSEIIEEVADPAPTNEGPVKAPAIETSLINAFSARGIGSTIVRDEALVDEEGNPQRARVESTGPKAVRITINPQLIEESEGLYHEFGHVYVDMLGVDNPIVRAGMRQAMEDTKLVEQVQKAYPEKTGDALAKEVFMHKIGKEGSRIVRQNPSKFQVILNRFFRAVGKFLGIDPNAAATLAEEMFAGKLRKSATITLDNYIEESRQLTELQDIADSAKVIMIDTVRNLEFRTKASAMTANTLKQVKELENTLEGITRVQDFVNYTTKSVEVLNEVTRHIELLENKWESDWGLNDQYNVAHVVARAVSLMDMFKDPFGGQDIISAIMSAAEIAPQSEKDSEGMQKLLSDLNVIVGQRASLDVKIRTIAIPILSAILISEKNPELMQGVQNEIDTLRDNFARTGKLRFTRIDKTSPEYLDAVAVIKKRKLNKAEADKLLLDVKIAQLIAKASPDYNTTVEQLRKDYVDRTGAGLFFTSPITDSDVNFQRMQLIYARSMSNKQERTRDLAYRLSPALKDLRRRSNALGRSEISSLQLYERFVETREMTIDGKKEKVDFIISPFDTQRYNSDIYNKKKDLKKKYGIETDKKYKAASKKTLRSYYSELNKYIDSISEPIPEAADKYKVLTDELKAAKDRLAKLREAGKKELEKREAGLGSRSVDMDQIELSIINQEATVAELEKKMLSVYSDKKFRGELLQPNKSYISDAYKQIKDDPFYQFYTEELKKLQALLPQGALVKESYEDMSYMVPSGRISMMSRLESEGILSTIKETGIDALMRTDQELDYGGHYLRESGLNVVPIYFNNARPSNEVSKDLGALLMLFGDMAHSFEEKNKILGFVELYSFLYSSSDKGVGPQAINRSGVLRRASEFIGKPRLLRGIKDAVGAKTQSNKQKMIQAYIDANFYNRKFTQGSVSANKFINGLMKFTAYDLLGFNMLQTGNQFVLDNLAEIGETYGAQFYNRLDKTRGQAAMMKLMADANFMGDFKSLAPNSKLAQMIRYFDIKFDAFEIGSGYKAGNRLLKDSPADLLLTPQGLVNLQIKLNRLGAVLASYKGKLKDKNGNVLLNENGDPADLIDLFQDRGDGVYELSKEIDPSIVDAQRVRNIFRGITRRANQIEAAVDRPNITRTVFRPVFLMRGWIPGGLQQRWGYNMGATEALQNAVRGRTSQHLSEEIGRVEIARYASIVKYFSMLAREFRDVGAWKDFAKVLNPLSEGPSRYSDAEAVAIRRQAQAMVSLATSMILPGILKDGDDDEDPNHFLLYQLRRLRSELLFYANPMEFYNIGLRSPTATARPFENLAKILYLSVLHAQNWTGLVLDQEELDKKLFYQRKSGDFEKGDAKILKPATQLVPGLNGLLKDPEQAMKWFNQSGI